MTGLPLPAKAASFLLASFALAALLAGCTGGESVPLTEDQVIATIPWTPPESAHYRIMRGSDLAGSGDLIIEESTGALLLRQEFEAAQEEITDRVSAEVDLQTLRPRTVTRTISGPEGQRRCEAVYGDRSVTVEQQSEEGERTDELNLPRRPYDTWADLFLWRTLAFSRGLEVAYSGVLTCALARPEIIRVKLEVKELETVRVPAGTFETWRLEIRSAGETTKAWYANNPERTLVRYDNGRHVFELESKGLADFPQGER